MSKIVLKLYVAGQTMRSKRALENLERIRREHLSEQTELVVIDVMEKSHLAEQHKILVTPTLVKESPPPARRIIGDLNDTDQVVLALDLPLEVTKGNEE